jgi:hypothetical protein
MQSKFITVDGIGLAYIENNGRGRRSIKTMNRRESYGN